MTYVLQHLGDTTGLHEEIPILASPQKLMMEQWKCGSAKALINDNKTGLLVVRDWINHKRIAE